MSSQILKPEVVGIELAGNRPDHLVVAHDKFEVQALIEIERLQDALVPIARPALVHDLGLEHRQKVLRFLVHDREQVSFPFSEERIVVADEQQQILVGLDRHLVDVGLGDFCARMNAMKGIDPGMRGFDQAFELLTVTELADRQIAPALPAQRMGRVEHVLDLLDPDRRILRVMPHAQRVRFEELDCQRGASGAIREIVFEEIVMAVDVRDGQDLQQQRVVAH